MQEDLAYLSVREIRDRVRNQTLSPEQIAHHFLDRIESINTTLQAYTYTDSEMVIKNAETLSREIAINPKKMLALPLLGVPFCVSDLLLEVAGTPLSNGSSHKQTSCETTTVIKVLQTLGALFLGRTHVTEYGISDICSNPAFGVCRNPWQLTHTVGSPCPGGAVAVSMGLASFSVDANFRGGIETAASHTGVYGLSFSSRKIAMPSALEALLKSVLHYGITARSPEDLAIIADVVAQPSAEDPDTYPYYHYQHEKYLLSSDKPCKIGWMPELGIAKASEEALEEYDLFTKKIQNDSLKIERVFYQEASNSHKHAKEIYASHMALFLSSLPTKQQAKFTEETISWAKTASNLSSGDYLFGQAVFRLLKQQAYAMLNQYDVLMTPVCPVESFSRALPPENLDPVIGLQSFVWPFALLGVCRMVIPCGKTKEGLPIGVQLIAREHEEGELIRCAAAIAKQNIGFTQPPLAEELTPLNVP